MNYVSTIQVSYLIPALSKLPGPKVAGKHPLNGAPQAKKVLDHVDPFQRKTRETEGNGIDPAKSK